MPSKHLMKSLFRPPVRKLFLPLALAGAALCPFSRAQMLQSQLDVRPPDSGSVPASSLASSSAFEGLPDSPGTLIAEPTPEPAYGQSSTNSKDKQDSPTRSAPPKRLFGIVPNFRTVSTDTKLPPQGVKEKFVDTVEDSFDYSALALFTAVATEGYISTATPEFGRGGVGFSRYLWHSAADQTIENYLVEFLIPVVRHEDTRFYTLTRGSFAERAGYSIKRVFVTRSDSGHNTFNSGEVVGAAASAGISNFYYPRGERNVSNFITKYGTNLGIDAASYFVKEFYPEISNAFSRHKSASTP